MPENVRVSRGIRIIIAFHVVSLVLWGFGQTGALMSYDTVAAWGLQPARTLIDPVIVEVNRGIALADTFVMLPLSVVAIVGLVRRRFFGAVASWFVFGMTVYWPTVFWCTQHFYGRTGVTYTPTTLDAIIVPAVLMAVSVWGSWFLARNRRRLD